MSCCCRPLRGTSIDKDNFGLSYCLASWSFIAWMLHDLNCRKVWCLSAPNIIMNTLQTGTLVKNALQSVLERNLLNNDRILLAYLLSLLLLGFRPTRHQERRAQRSCPKTLPGIGVNGLSGCGATPTQVLLYLMGPLGSCTMDPKPFCKLLSTLPDYSGVEEFIGHAVQDDGTSGGPGAFVQWVCGLWGDARTRRSLGDVQQAWLAKKSGASPPHSYSPLCIEAFNLWRLMHKRYKPRACRPVDDVPMSRSVRRKLSHLGACKYNVGSTHQHACQMAQDLWDLIKQMNTSHSR